jgi:alanine racemase
LAFIEINKNNLLHNINLIQKISNKEIFAVIKDNAYGHGIKEIAKILKEAGIKRVCVRNNFEAKLVEPYFKEILVFFPELYYNTMNISYTISDIKSLKRCKHRKIHLKFDTGMHRNALSLEDLDEILKIAFNKFEVKGIFSHFCCSDEIGNDTFIQLQRFKELRNRVINFCNKNNFDLPKFHIANSDSVFKLPQNELFDYVRPGIALYGGMINENLKPVMSLWGEAIKVMEIKNNQYVGYNKRYKFNENVKITLIDLGYSDGILYFDKELILKNTKAVGKISMDSMSVIGEYKKVCIFDDVREFIKNYSHTITYDVLTKLKSSIKRVVK